MRNVRILFLCFLLSPIFIVGQEKCENCLPVVNRQKTINELIKENDPLGFIISGPFSSWRSFKDIPPNSTPVINNVFLSKTQIAKNCGSQSEIEHSCSVENNLIEINVSANDFDGDFLLYEYKVSAGKIIRDGATVLWDVSEAKPGKHTVSIVVDDGCGLCFQPVLKEIEITECFDCQN